MLAWSPGLRSTISEDARGGKTRYVPLSEGAKGIPSSCDSFLRSAWVSQGLKDVAHCRTAPRFSGVRLSLA